MNKVDIKITASGSEDAKKAITNVQNALKETSNVARKSSTDLALVYGQAFNSIGSKIISLKNIFLGTFATMAFRSVIRPTIRNEEANLAIRNLVRNTEDANRLINDLLTFKTATPLNNAAIEESARQLLSIGVNSKNVTNELKLLGDIAQGNSGVFSKLVDVYSRVGVEGQLGMEGIKQMTESSIPIVDALSSSLGKTKEEVLALAKSGKIDFNSFGKALNQMGGPGGQFFGSMDRLMMNPAKSIEQLSKQIESVTIKIGNLALPALSALAVSTNSFLNGLAKNNALKSFVSDLEKLSTGLNTASRDSKSFFEGLGASNLTVAAGIAGLGVLGTKGIGFAGNFANQLLPTGVINKELKEQEKSIKVNINKILRQSKIIENDTKSFETDLKLALSELKTIENMSEKDFMSDPMNDIFSSYSEALEEKNKKIDELYRVRNKKIKELESLNKEAKSKAIPYKKIRESQQIVQNIGDIIQTTTLITQAITFGYSLGTAIYKGFLESPAMNLWDTLDGKKGMGSSFDRIMKNADEQMTTFDEFLRNRLTESKKSKDDLIKKLTELSPEGFDVTRKTFVGTQMGASQINKVLKLQASELSNDELIKVLEDNKEKLKTAGNGSLFEEYKKLFGLDDATKARIESEQLFKKEVEQFTTFVKNSRNKAFIDLMSGETNTFAIDKYFKITGLDPLKEATGKQLEDLTRIFKNYGNGDVEVGIQLFEKLIENEENATQKLLDARKAHEDAIAKELKDSARRKKDIEDDLAIKEWNRIKDKNNKILEEQNKQLDIELKSIEDAAKKKIEALQKADDMISAAQGIIDDKKYDPKNARKAEKDRQKEEEKTARRITEGMEKMAAGRPVSRLTKDMISAYMGNIRPEELKLFDREVAIAAKLGAQKRKGISDQEGINKQVEAKTIEIEAQKKQNELENRRDNEINDKNIKEIEDKKAARASVEQIGNEFEAVQKAEADMLNAERDLAKAKKDFEAANPLKEYPEEQRIKNDSIFDRVSKNFSEAKKESGIINEQFNKDMAKQEENIINEQFRKDASDKIKEEENRIEEDKKRARENEAEKEFQDSFDRFERENSKNNGDAKDYYDIFNNEKPKGSKLSDRQALLDSRKNRLNDIDPKTGRPMSDRQQLLADRLAAKAAKEWDKLPNQPKAKELSIEQLLTKIVENTLKTSIYAKEFSAIS